MPQSIETRCHGRTGMAGKPLPRCVLCERRVIPHGQRVQLMVPPNAVAWVFDLGLRNAQKRA